MNKLIFGVLLVLAVLTTSRAQAQPILTKQDSQVFFQDNGGVDVIYTLTFRETSTRSKIRQAGPFYQPVHFTKAILWDGDTAHPVNMQALPGDYYKIDFQNFKTRPGQSYRVELHHRINHRFADKTQTDDGKSLLALWFNPIRWTLPVEKSVIKLVLPLALPETVQKPEDITPEMVDALGLVTDPQILNQQDKWAMVFADYHDQRRLTFYAEKKNVPAQGVHLVKVYLPAAAMPLALAADAQTQAERDERADSAPLYNEKPHSDPVQPWQSFAVLFALLWLRRLAWYTALSFLLNSLWMALWRGLLGRPLNKVDAVLGTQLYRDILTPNSDSLDEKYQSGLSKITGWSSFWVPLPCKPVSLELAVQVQVPGLGAAKRTDQTSPPFQKPSRINSWPLS